jgi:hypothetical protein
MDKNYYCDRMWFDTYEEAREHANSMMLYDDVFRMVYTKSEMDSQINHEEECGK